MKSECCRLCGSESLVPFGSFDLQVSNESTLSREGSPSLLVRCPRCGIVFQDDFPLESLSGEYEESYYSEEVVLEEHIKYLYSCRWRTLGGYLTKQSRVLDFGCGKGYFLRQLRAVGLDDIHGVELSRSARRFLRGEGYDVAGSLSEFGSAEPFDAISLFHVLEHLEDPRSFLESLKDSLAADGKIIIEVPNIDSFGFKRFGPEWFYLQKEHLYYFDQKSLISLIERTGYRVEMSYRFGGFWVTKGNSGRKKVLNLPKSFKNPLIGVYLWGCDLFGLHDFIGVVARIIK